MTQMPRISHSTKGALLFAAGLVLFLYVTNILTIGLGTIILLAALVLMGVGFVEIDGYNKLTRLFNNKR